MDTIEPAIIVTQKGDQKALWWTGRQVVCPCCAAQIKLTRNAPLSAHVVVMSSNKLRVGCPECHVGQIEVTP